MIVHGQMLLSDMTYSSVVQFLQNDVKLVAPSYLTICGTDPGQGCICTMERSGKKSSLENIILSVCDISAICWYLLLCLIFPIDVPICQKNGKNQAFVVQTNMDNWRYAAIKEGCDAPEEHLWQVCVWYYCW